MLRNGKATLKKRLIKNTDIRVFGEQIDNYAYSLKIRIIKLQKN